MLGDQEEQAGDDKRGGGRDVEGGGAGDAGADRSARQPCWVDGQLVPIYVAVSHIDLVFFTEDNFFNVTRNFAFIGIIAMGMTAVIITGGIDLSVGSVVGLSGIVTGLVLPAGHSW